jgi:hypothetical protein
MSLIYSDMDTGEMEKDFLIVHCDRLTARVTELEEGKHALAMYISGLARISVIKDYLYHNPTYEKAENLLAIRDLEQQAKGVRESLSMAKKIGGCFLHECLFEDAAHELYRQAKALGEQK